MPQSILIATIMRPEGDTGVQTHCRAFLAWAKQRVLPVTLVTPYSNPRSLVYPMFAWRRLIDPWHKPASVRWYRHWHELFLRRALVTVLADDQPCTIYAQCPLSAAAALRARTSPTQRVVMAVHFNISQADEWVGKGMICEGSALYCAIRKFEANILPRLDGLVFVSDFMRREVAARIPATTEVPYRILPNFLQDPGPVVYTVQPKTDLICIGTLEPRKNQRYAIEIVAAATRLGRPLTMTVIGDGPDRGMLESIVLKEGIGEQVFFAGRLLNAAAHLQDHLACIHVAQLENLPLTLIEALSRGVPVFAPAVGGVPEVFANGCEGRFIPLNNAEEAARTIIEWLDSPITMTAARHAARTRFLAHFESNKVATDLMDFLSRPVQCSLQPSRARLDRATE